MSQCFTLGGQSIGASISASVLPVNILVWSPWSPRDSQESSPAPSSKPSVLQRSAFMVQLSHPYTTTGKTIALTRRTFVGKVMSPSRGFALNSRPLWGWQLHDSTLINYGDNQTGSNRFYHHALFSCLYGLSRSNTFCSGSEFYLVANSGAKWQSSRCC